MDTAEVLLHYSAEPFVGPLETIHFQKQRDEDPKPFGLWVSVPGADDWKSWCEAEGFSLNSLNYVSQIILRDNAKILRLSSSSAIRRFTAERRVRGSRWNSFSIDWRSVAGEYDGIIIAPYQWSCRMDDECRWYYGWDCASGCIWHASAVKEIRPIAGEHPAIAA